MDKEDKKNDEKQTFSAVSGIIEAIIIVCLWIALFCGFECSVILLPLLSTCFYITMGVYMNKEGEFDGFCIFFMVFCAFNLIVSIVAFCIEASSGIGFSAVLNLLLPSVILGRKKT